MEHVFSSEDNIYIKTCRNLKDFLSKGSSRNTLKSEKKNIEQLFAEIAHDHFDQTHCRKPSSAVITLLQLKTQLMNE